MLCMIRTIVSIGKKNGWNGIFEFSLGRAPIGEQNLDQFAKLIKVANGRDLSRPLLWSLSTGRALTQLKAKESKIWVSSLAKKPTGRDSPAIDSGPLNQGINSGLRYEFFSMSFIKPLKKDQNN